MGLCDRRPHARFEMDGVTRPSAGLARSSDHRLLPSQRLCLSRTPRLGPTVACPARLVHVLADYGTTVESELQVFAFIARANDDMRAFSLLAMVVSLFETGYLQRGAGLFEASPGHLEKAEMASRVADAMRRGALCQGSIDFMGLDWFDFADMPVKQARDLFSVPPKSKEALSAGSVGPWEPGGISPFQVKSGTSLAETEGRPYESFGAQVVEDP